MDNTEDRFEALGLGEEVLRAVKDAGYETPTPIQAESIPLVLLGRDVLGAAQTGTGKTASYTLPIIDILASGTSKSRMPRCLILAPTRELAQQIAESFKTYSKYHTLNHALLIGGEAFSGQEKMLAKNPDVLVATPGRLLDAFERGLILMQGVKVLVIDEADRMLDMGFIPDVDRIVKTLPRIRQTLLFSATLGPEILRLAKEYLINPKEVRVAPPATVAQTVEHTIVTVAPSEKRHVLRDLIESENVQSALIFCNRKKDIGVLCDSLRRHRLNARELHGDMVQYLRTETLAAFKEGLINLLVCSDVAGRGLDIDNVSHVFNYDVPINPEDYVHRIGRTGRAGKAGRAITLVTPEESEQVAAIKRLIKVDIPMVSSDGAPMTTQDLEDQDDRPRRPRRGRGQRSGRGRAQPERPATTPPPDNARASAEKQPTERSEATHPVPERQASEPLATERPEAENPVTGRRAPGASTSSRAERAAPKSQRGRRAAPKEDPVVGMGDHVPEFMRLPVTPRKGEAKHTP